MSQEQLQLSDEILGTDSIAVLARIARKSLCFVEPTLSDADFKIAVRLGSHGLLMWPADSNLISVTSKGLQTLADRGVSV